MPALIAWLSSFVAGVIGFFAAWITKRAAIALAVLASFTALVTVLWTALAALWAAMSLAFPSAFLTHVSCFVPLDTLHADLSIVVSAYIARLTYDYYVAGLKLVASAN